MDRVVYALRRWGKKEKAEEEKRKRGGGMDGDREEERGVRKGDFCVVRPSTTNGFASTIVALLFLPPICMASIIEWHHMDRCQVVAVLFPEHNLAPAAAEVPLPL